MLLFASLAFFVCTALIARKWGFFRLPIFFKPPHLYLTEVAGAFAVFIGTALIGMPVLTSLWVAVSGRGLLEELDSFTQGWLRALSIVVTALGLLIYYYLLSSRAQIAVARLPGSSDKFKKLCDFSIGAGTWLISFPAVIAISQLVAMFFPDTHLNQVAVNYLKMTMGEPKLFLATAFLFVCIVPIIEEVLFRGFLQTWFNQSMERGKSIAATAAIFAIFHYAPSQGVGNAELLLSLFVMACFLGFLYERQQSLLAPIGLHATFNAISIIILIISS